MVVVKYLRIRVKGWRGKSVSSPRLVKRSVQFSRTTLNAKNSWKTWIYDGAGSQGLYKSKYWGKGGA